jgi:hypothetical protein
MFLNKTREQEKEMANKKTAVVKKELSNRTFLFLLVLEIVLFAFVFNFLVLKNQRMKSDNIFLELVQEKENNLEIESKKKRIEKIEEMFDFLSGEKETQLNTLLAEEEEIPELVLNLEDLVKKAGFEMINIDFFGSSKKKSGDQDENNNQKEIEDFFIEIEVEGGGYHNFKKMIEKIENNMRLFEVERFSFATDQETFTIKLKTFIYK